MLLVCCPISALPLSNSLSASALQFLFGEPEACDCAVVNLMRCSNSPTIIHPLDNQNVMDYPVVLNTYPCGKRLLCMMCKQLTCA